MIWFGIELALQYNTPAILWNQGFLSYMTTSWEGIFSTKGIIYGILTSINAVINYGLLAALTVDRKRIRR